MARQAKHLKKSGGYGVTDMVLRGDSGLGQGTHIRGCYLQSRSNDRQQSRLRLINPGGEAVAITITGIDDVGEAPGDGVTLSVPAGLSRTLTAAQLESGEGLQGALGDGAGKWRLSVEAQQPIIVMSLLSSPTGHLTNLSTTPGRGSADP